MKFYSLQNISINTDFLNHHLRIFLRYKTLDFLVFRNPIALFYTFLHLHINKNILITFYKKYPIINFDVAQKIVSCITKGTESPSASAYYCTLPFSRFLKNFFLMVNKTSIPVQLFSYISKQVKQFIRAGNNFIFLL